MFYFYRQKNISTCVPKCTYFQPFLLRANDSNVVVWVSAIFVLNLRGKKLPDFTNDKMNSKVERSGIKAKTSKININKILHVLNERTYVSLIELLYKLYLTVTGITIQALSQ